MNKFVKVSVAAAGLALSSFAFAGSCDLSNTAAWSDTREDDPSQMDVVSPGHEGTQCMLTVASTSDNSQRARVQDTSPASENSYRARFTINVDALGSLADNERNKTLNVQCVNADATHGLTCPNVGIIQLRLQGDGGTNIFRSFVTDEGPATAADNRRKFDIAVGSGVQPFEFQWIRASADGVADGVFRLWANGNTNEGSPDIEFTDLDNYDYVVTQMNMGLIQATNAWTTSKAGVNIELDEFESRRTTGIGVN